MMDLNSRRKRRKLFYTASIFILIIQTLCFSVIYILGIKDEYNQRIKQVSAGILEQKRSRAEFVVKAKIAEIIHLEALLKTHFDITAQALIDRMSYLIKADKLNEVLAEGPLWLPFGKLDYQIIDLESRLILASSLSNDDKSIIRSVTIAKKAIVSDRYEIKVFLLSENFYNYFLKEVRSFIYDTALPEDNNLWLDQILNYEGGQSCSLRLVHPEIPDIEGSTISILTNGHEGNLQSLVELENLKHHGEAFTDYNIKDPVSEEIIRKLSYAKVYEKYNWVISTGINLDELDNYVKSEKNQLKDLYRIKIFHFLFILFISLLLVIVLLYFFEKKVSERIKGDNLQLREEKKKLSKAYDQMKELAFVDSLTGLSNRRAMFQRLEEESSRYKRDKQDFCIIMADIDKFKNINDAYGHDAGDYILQELAKVLKENIRLEDRAARWGGEEFLIFINSANCAEGVLVSEKLRKAVEEKRFIYDGIVIKVTMTFGVSSSRDAKGFVDQINIADQHLYIGKRSTRNCVVS
ncbi:MULTISPECIES: diguanylate cyclase [unclassified Oceanispirochaeta]|nr:MULTISPECIES: diguanylate cyclase [unclassified Oceanispirochaeta]MBF9014188.1 diguanylate cyclase [Oceanispirochaeta sp. M2]NPD70678.1 diguanylate cyclase [Oceanispirochaeta sp. M1]